MENEMFEWTINGEPLVRKDEAEQMAKEFADFCLAQHCDYLLGSADRKDIDELFTEYKLSLKAKKAEE